MSRLSFLLVLILLVADPPIVSADDPAKALPAKKALPDSEPITSADIEKIEAEAGKLAKTLTAEIAQSPKSVDLYSRRGDAWFNLAKFPEAVADYDKMIELSPDLASSHWRRGIALFFAGRYEDGAKQFDAYHAFDDVDRENGIWKYLCQVRASDDDTAKKGLLKYKKDDRPPLPQVFEMFAGKSDPEQMLRAVTESTQNKDERGQRMFYAHLYAGFYHLVHDNPDAARSNLAHAVRNEWAPTAGFGPRYMWHTARLQWQLLSSTPEKSKPASHGK